MLPEIWTGVIATKVALAAHAGEKTFSELSSEFGVHQTLIHKWVRQLKVSATGIRGLTAILAYPLDIP